MNIVTSETISTIERMIRQLEPTADIQFIDSSNRLLLYVSDFSSSIAHNLGPCILDALLENGTLNSIADVNWGINNSIGWISIAKSIGIVIGQDSKCSWPFDLLVSEQLVAPVLVIGGASGSGKSTIVKRLESYLPGKCILPRVYTNRPRRPEEIDGAYYYFVESTTDEIINKIGIGRLQFARGFAYWMDKPAFYASLRRNYLQIHILYQSRSHQILKSKERYPQFISIYLNVPDEDVYNRLSNRNDLKLSVEYNQTLDGMHVADFIINNQNGMLEIALRSLLDVIKTTWPHIFLDSIHNELSTLS